MKIYKYIHSCLVFEQNDFKILVDPGKFSFAEGLVKPEDFADVKVVIITHIHPDHLDIDNLKEIIALSNAYVYANHEVAKELSKNGIDSLPFSEGDNELGPFKFFVFEVKHEALLDSQIPQMSAFVVNGKVLHPVDSFEQSMQQYKGIELLLLPIMAPFTTELTVADFADKIQPKQILPVHDGSAKEFFLKQRYENYQKHFDKQCIKFLDMMKPGDFIVLD